MERLWWQGDSDICTSHTTKFRSSLLRCPNRKGCMFFLRGPVRSRGPRESHKSPRILENVVLAPHRCYGGGCDRLRADLQQRGWARVTHVKAPPCVPFQEQKPGSRLERVGAAHGKAFGGRSRGVMLCWDSGIGATPALVRQPAQGTLRLFSRRAGLAWANSLRSGGWLWFCISEIFVGGEGGLRPRANGPLVIEVVVWWETVTWSRNPWVVVVVVVLFFY